MRPRDKAERKVGRKEGRKHISKKEYNNPRPVWRVSKRLKN